MGGRFGPRKRCVFAGVEDRLPWDFQRDNGCQERGVYLKGLKEGYRGSFWGIMLGKKEMCVLGG